MKAEKLNASFGKCTTSLEQMNWILVNRAHIVLIIDNDETGISFGQDKQGDVVSKDLISCIGCSVGVIDLLDALGIESEKC